MTHVGSIIWGRWLKRKERCQNTDAPSCIYVKPGPRRGEHQQLTTFCESQVCSFLSVRVVLGIHHITVACSLSFVLYHFWSQRFSRILSHVMKIWCQTVFGGGGCLGCVYSQVSRLSLSMCDPERTVSMSIRRSELRPSGMQGISSSPSDIGSTGSDSCKVIEEVSPESPGRSQKCVHNLNINSWEEFGWAFSPKQGLSL